MAKIRPTKAERRYRLEMRKQTATTLPKVDGILTALQALDPRAFPLRALNKRIRTLQAPGGENSDDAEVVNDGRESPR
jgi:hypothetical protein